VEGPHVSEMRMAGVDWSPSVSLRVTLHCLLGKAGDFRDDGFPFLCGEGYGTPRQRNALGCASVMAKQIGTRWNPGENGVGLRYSFDSVHDRLRYCLK
jgi:hypothetical protein